MQPPRPFPGAQYDKSMFTFLPLTSSRDGLGEPSRKRKLVASDQQITEPAPSIRDSFSGKSDPKLNMSGLQGKELQNSFSSSPHGKSLYLRDYSQQSQYSDQNNAAMWHPNRRDLHDTRSEYTGYSSFSGQLQSPHPKDSSPLSSMSKARTRRKSRWSPLIGEHFNQLGDHEHNAVVAREENTSHFQGFENSGSQKPVQTKVESSGLYEPASKNLGESQSLQQNLLEPGAFIVGSDGKGCPTPKTTTWPSSMTGVFHHVENHPSSALVAREPNASPFQEFQNFRLQKPVQMNVVAADSHEQPSNNSGDSESLQQNFHIPRAIVGSEEGGCHEGLYKCSSPPNVKRNGGAFSLAGFDATKMSGDNVDSSIQLLQREIQNAIRLLRASGIDLPDNYNGQIQGHEDDVKAMKLTPDSGVQNLKHSLTEATVSKKIDSCDKLGEKGSVNMDEGCKQEHGASALTEKLWDGTLQLSSSVSVSAIAFFKSGEKMQDFSWSESVEVKGKVRLEAFEKYVQDLPRSRTRGLMVMSLCWKDGSSDASRKSMKEVARKYKEGKRVGFAQLSTGIDMYICPHSDTIITILAKHGFFKGLTAVKDKCDPLIGCVVWRKNTSSVPATKTNEINGQQSGQSVSSPSISSVPQVARENPTVANENGKVQTVTEGGEKSRGDNSPEFCISPSVDQPNHTTIPQNKALISGTTTQMSEFKTDTEHNKPVLKPFAATSDDDDDLPEFDFRAAVPQTLASRTFEVRTVDSRVETEHRDSHVPRSMSAQMMSENLASSRSPADFHFQGQVPQNIGHRSESCIPNFPIQPQKQNAVCPVISKPPDFHFQGPAPQNRGHQPELQQQKQANCEAGPKPRNLFDDDMPEWCPPDFTKPRHEVAQRAGPSFVSSHSKVPMSGYADSASGHVPPLLPTPPSTQYPSAPHLPGPPADQQAPDGFTHKDDGAPPGFAPKPAFRPRFDPPRMKDSMHPSRLRGSRP